MPKPVSCCLSLLLVLAGLALAERVTGNLQGLGFFLASAGAAWLYGLATDDHVRRRAPPRESELGIHGDVRLERLRLEQLKSAQRDVDNAAAASSARLRNGGDHK